MFSDSIKKEDSIVLTKLEKIIDEKIYQTSIEDFEEFENYKYKGYNKCKFVVETKSGNVTHLSLTDLKFNKFPNEIIELKYLKNLDLRKTQIRIIPENIKKLKELQSLDLRETQVIEIPKAIIELKNLSILYLYEDQINDIEKWGGKLNNLKKLYLKGNMINKLPSWIRDLTNLEELYLEELKIENLPEWICKLVTLNKLFLWEVKIKELPLFLYKLKNLKELWLRGTEIKELPFNIGKLKNLQELDLRSTQITVLPDNMQNLKNLKCLDLGNTKLENLPEWMSSLKNLNSLVLGNLKMKELPNWLCELINLKILALWKIPINEFPEKLINNLTKLEYLDLRGTQIEEVPATIKKLSNLKTLFLGSHIKELPECVKELVNLKTLHFWSDNVKEIPKWLCELSNLKELFFSGSQLEEIPKDIVNLTNLEELNLSYSKIKKIPKIVSELTSLKVLDLEETNIEEIPKWIIKLKNLTMLNLKSTKLVYFPKILLAMGLPIRNEKYMFMRKGINCNGLKFKDVPPEVIEQGRVFIEKYIHYEKVNLNEVKIIFIGDGAVGKSSLIKRIQLNDFDEKESATLGITITDHIFEVSKTKYIAHMWDFGGQEVMHSTHKFFLSERCIYIIVTEARKEISIEYWLKHVESLGGKSPTLVVINKIDTYKQASLNEKFLREKYTDIIKDFYRISCKDGTNIEELKYGIKKCINSISNFRFKWPIKWIGIKKELEKMQRNYISFSEYIKLCEKYGVENELLQSKILSFLKDMGIVCSFENYPINNRKILNPKWITNAIYKIMTDIDVKNKNGYLLKGNVKNIINKKLYNREYYKVYKDELCDFTCYKYKDEDEFYILNLMEQFELCYSLNLKYELIPALMDKSQPEFSFDKENSLRYKLLYNFLPKSIIHKLIVKNSRNIKDNYVWNTGVVLRDTDYNSEAFIKLDEEDKMIDIYIVGNFGRELLSKIRNDLKDINSDFKFSEDDIKEYIVKNGIDIDYRNVIEHYKAGKRTIFIWQIRKEYSVIDLLGDIQPYSYTMVELGGYYIDKIESLKIGDTYNMKDNNGQMNFAKNQATINTKSKLEFFKRKNRRNLLIKNIAQFLIINDESFFEFDTNDDYCKKTFLKLNNITCKEKIKGKNYEDNIELSINYLNNLNINFDDKKVRMFFYGDYEIEAVKLSIKDIFENILKLTKISGFLNGRGDFIVVSDDLDYGICIQRSEYFYKVSLW